MSNNEIKDDLIVGQGAILDILKLSHWRYMDAYLKLPNCPITLIGGRWVTRHSLLDPWLNDVMFKKVSNA